MLGQPAVEHGEVGGDEIRQAQVVLQHFVEEQQRLLDHRHLEHVVELRVEGWVGRGGVDVAQAEPLADEVLGERRRLGVLEHALDLPAERVGLVQLALLGEGEQFLVGHRTPQEIGQPAGQGEVVELAGLLAEEQEVRRHQHGLEADAHRLLERVLLVQLGLHASQERLDVLIGHGPPESAAHEVAEDALGIGQRLLRDDLQAVAVVGVGRRRLAQVAEEPAMAGRRPGLVQRPFDLHPLHGQSRPLVVRPPRLSRPPAGVTPSPSTTIRMVFFASRRSTNSTTVGLSAGTSK